MREATASSLAVLYKGLVRAVLCVVITQARRSKLRRRFVALQKDFLHSQVLLLLYVEVPIRFRCHGEDRRNSAVVR